MVGRNSKKFTTIIALSISLFDAETTGLNAFKNSGSLGFNYIQ
jgi:hypothetical protein